MLCRHIPWTVTEAYIDYGGLILSTLGPVEPYYMHVLAHTFCWKD